MHGSGHKWNKLIPHRVLLETHLSVRSDTSAFEAAILSNLDAAHNFARWMMRNDEDARDVVQESCMKALRGFESFQGGEFRVWLLAIVRNTCISMMRKRKTSSGGGREESLDDTSEPPADCESYDPQAIAIRAADCEFVRRSIDKLPALLREAVVLREMEGMSYREIGRVVGVPIGTVMSRLARGRAQLQSLLSESQREGAP
jgi:RNA polymerase sigma factor (sigma-70 family)